MMLKLLAIMLITIDNKHYRSTYDSSKDDIIVGKVSPAKVQE